jgi:hypothetical protein
LLPAQGVASPSDERFDRSFDLLHLFPVFLRNVVRPDLLQEQLRKTQPLAGNRRKLREQRIENGLLGEVRLPALRQCVAGAFVGLEHFASAHTLR